MLTIALYEPKIPQNVGNIARLSVALEAKLQLVGKLGFMLTDKHLKRAGLDYWQFVSYEHILDAKKYFADLAGKVYSIYSTKANELIYSHNFVEDEILIFGSEDKGLPADFLNQNIAKAYKIPQNKNSRSLNLSNSVAIVAYEAWRQLSFT